MRRRLFTLLCAISLLLCLATMVAWVRSYLSSADGTGDDITLSDFGTDPFWWASSMRGDLFLIRQAGDNWGEPQPGFNMPGFEYSVSASAVGSHQQYRVSYWALCALFGLFPAIWLIAFLRRRRYQRRIKHGLCASCGYDLRATPGRCPECGAVTTTATQTE